MVSGFRVDDPAGFALLSALLLAIILPILLIAEGPWLWSEAWDYGDVNAGRGWIFNSLAPYVTAFAAPALVLAVARWLLALFGR